MDVKIIVMATLFTIIAVALFIYAAAAAREKGPILSNTWIFATEEERRRIDKSAEYRMVARVFGMLGAVVLLLAVYIVTSWAAIAFLMGILIIILIAYAIIESVRTEMKR